MHSKSTVYEAVVKFEGAYSEEFTSCRLIACYCFGRVVVRRHASSRLLNYPGKRELSGARTNSEIPLQSTSRPWNGFYPKTIRARKTIYIRFLKSVPSRPLCCDYLLTGRRPGLSLAGNQIYTDSRKFTPLLACSVYHLVKRSTQVYASNTQSYV